MEYKKLTTVISFFLCIVLLFSFCSCEKEPPEKNLEKENEVIVTSEGQKVVSQSSFDISVDVSGEEKYCKLRTAILADEAEPFGRAMYLDIVGKDGAVIDSLTIPGRGFIAASKDGNALAVYQITVQNDASFGVRMHVFKIDDLVSDKIKFYGMTAITVSGNLNEELDYRNQNHFDSMFEDLAKLISEDGFSPILVSIVGEEYTIPDSQSAVVSREFIDYIANFSVNDIKEMFSQYSEKQ